MNYGKIGPGPASLNIREGRDPLVSFSSKKVSSMKGDLS
jgi:hypothetical protein